MKALTGENKLDLGIVNNMILKQKARLDAAAKAMEESKARLDAEKNQKHSNEIQVDEILTWATLLMLSLEQSYGLEISTSRNTALLKLSRNFYAALPSGESGAYIYMSGE